MGGVSASLAAFISTPSAISGARMRYAVLLVLLSMPSWSITSWTAPCSLSMIGGRRLAGQVQHGGGRESCLD